MKYWIDFLKLFFPTINVKDKGEVIGITILMTIVFSIIGYMMYHGYM